MNREDIMAPFNLTVLIEQKKKGRKAARFTPDELTVKNGDSVSWGNGTKEPHLPWRTDSDHKLVAPIADGLDSPIAADNSSDNWVVADPAGTTIHYRCKVHPRRKEFGTVVVT
jgi:plastocyanin